MRKDTFDRMLANQTSEREISEQRIADARYINQKLSTELDAYRQRLHATEVEVASLTRKLANTTVAKAVQERELEAVQRNAEQLAGDLELCKQQLLDAIANASQLRQQIAEIESQKEQYSRHLDAVQESLSHVSGESVDYQQKLGVLTEEAAMLKERLVIANEDVVRLKVLLSELSLLHSAKEAAKTRSSNVVDHIEQPRVDSLPFWALWGPYIKQQNLCSEASPTPLEFAGICEPAVMIFAFPKSGSTFLELAMSEALGIKDVGPPFDSDIEGLRFEDIAVHGARYPFVIKNHVWSTPNNVELLKFFGIRPVVLVRNIYDCLLSLAEDPQFANVNDRVICVGYVRSDFISLSLEERLWIVIRGFLGWYLSFYASWARALESQSVNGLLVSYEELMDNQVATIKKIGKNVGAPMDDAFISGAIEKIGKGPHTRFNQGVIGRAQSVLTKEMKEAVIEAARVFAQVDFSPIGLTVPKA